MLRRFECRGETARSAHIWHLILMLLLAAVTGTGLAAADNGSRGTFSTSLSTARKPDAAEHAPKPWTLKKSEEHPILKEAAESAKKVREAQERDRQKFQESLKANAKRIDPTASDGQRLLHYGETISTHIR